MDIETFLGKIDKLWDKAEAIFETLPEEEKKRLREFPIWRYMRTAME